MQPVFYLNQEKSKPNEKSKFLDCSALTNTTELNSLQHYLEKPNMKQQPQDGPEEIASLRANYKPSKTTKKEYAKLHQHENKKIHFQVYQSSSSLIPSTWWQLCLSIFTRSLSTPGQKTICQVPEGGGEHRKMDESGCEIICGAQTPPRLRDRWWWWWWWWWWWR